MTTDTLDLTADTIDVRDIIARYEELVETIGNHGRQAEDDAEMHQLAAILTRLEGYGGDEQWRGDRYTSTLIDEVYFTYYAREMLEDCGTIPSDFPSWVEIDWEATARNIQADYTSVEINGRTYWYR